MERTIIVDKYKKIIPKEFDLVLSKEGNETYLFISKNESNRVLNIQCGILDGRMYGDSMSNITSKLIFKEIEYLLFPKYIIGDNNPTINYTGHQKVFDIPTDGCIFSQLPLEYKTEEDIDKGCTLITKYINEIAIPFFNYWQDIRDFLPFLETDDISFLSDIFSGDALFKKIIIWKLCSHPKFNEFTEEKTNQLTKRLQEIPNDKSFKKNYDRYIKIIKTLEKTKPLYEWDEKYLIQKPYIK